MNARERVLAMMRGEAVDRLPLMPITMMFAADQAGVPYGRYVSDHRVLADAQCRTAERFDLDYVSCISDPAREAADLGAAVRFFDDQPPAIDESRALLSDRATLATLRVPDPTAGGRMLDRIRAAALLKDRVGGSLIIEGWVEGPCAEGADLRGLNTLMYDFYDDPTFVRGLFGFTVEMELAFARAQIDAGADLIGVGDAASSLVGPHIYNEFVWPFQKQLIDGIRAMGRPVRLHICGDTRLNLEAMGRLGADIVDLDYPVPLADARAKMGPRQVLLGNLHPVQAIRDGTPASIRDALVACLRDAGPRYIAGAGCEIPRGTPDANLRAMAEFVRTGA
ncbi:MAG: uroporphyrinogen decarboxylase family protein [Planctomycetes bacterium]|nr:uroporphyrinogen decarboxylase family protein [Planctomycetota bacterium]